MLRVRGKTSKVWWWHPGMRPTKGGCYNYDYWPNDVRCMYQQETCKRDSNKKEKHTQTRRNRIRITNSNEHGNTTTTTPPPSANKNTNNVNIQQPTTRTAATTTLRLQMTLEHWESLGGLMTVWIFGTANMVVFLVPWSRCICMALDSHKHRSGDMIPGNWYRNEGFYSSSGCTHANPRSVQQL